MKNDNIEYNNMIKEVDFSTWNKFTVEYSKYTKIYTKKQICMWLNLLVTLWFKLHFLFFSRFQNLIQRKSSLKVFGIASLLLFSRSSGWRIKCIHEPRWIRNTSYEFKKKRLEQILLSSLKTKQERNWKNSIPLSFDPVFARFSGFSPFGLTSSLFRKRRVKLY